MCKVEASSPKEHMANGGPCSAPPHSPDSLSLTSSLGIDAQERRKIRMMIDGVLQTGTTRQFLKMLSYQAIPLIALIVMCGVLLSQVAQVSMRAKLLERIVRRNDHIGELVVSMQVERGLSAAFLSSNKTLMNTFAELQEARRRTDTAFTAIHHWHGVLSVSSIGSFPTKESLHDAISDHRNQVDRKAPETTFDTNIAFYTSINVRLIDVNIVYSRQLTSNSWSLLVAKESLLQATDFYGIERALGSVFYSHCQLNEDILQWFKIVKTQGDLMLQQSFNYDERVEDYYNDLLFLSGDTKMDLDTIRREIGSNINSCKKYGERGLESRSLQWFKNSTVLINHLATVRNDISDEISQYVQNIINYSNIQISIYSLVGGLTLMCCVILSVFQVFNSHKLLSSVSRYATDLTEKKVELALEKKLTQRLLFQMIPKSVAKQLQSGHYVKATLFESVTIYCSDIEGFTAIAATSTPMQVVHLLNRLYSTCDACINKYDVYKVETVSAYMIVSGVPEPTFSHAWEIAAMAIDLLAATQTLAVPHAPEEMIKLRIGLHTGSCAAGVVGLKMPRYCLFGDTVNTASRMETTGMARKIHISSNTKASLEMERGLGSCIIEPRGEIDVKGKGKMETYWLEGLVRGLVHPPTKRRVEWSRPPATPKHRNKGISPSSVLPPTPEATCTDNSSPSTLAPKVMLATPYDESTLAPKVMLSTPYDEQTVTLRSFSCIDVKEANVAFHTSFESSHL